MTSPTALLARLFLALWLASAVTLLAGQVGQLRAIPPEEPMADPVRRCQRLLAPGDVLGVVYSDTDPAQFLLAYRLAYRLYPAVTTAPYASIRESALVVETMRQRRPTCLLLLGAEDMPFPHGELVDRPAPQARLFRLAAAKR